MRPTFILVGDFQVFFAAPTSLGLTPDLPGDVNLFVSNAGASLSV